MIEGSWGTGKTALLHAMCQVAERAGVRVLRARGGLFEQHSPLRAVQQLLDSVGGSADRPARAAVSPAQDASVLRSLIEDIADGSGDAMEVGPQLYAFLSVLAGRGPVLVALDDADWCDRESVVALQYVARRLQSQRIWILATMRQRRSGAASTG